MSYEDNYDQTARWDAESVREAEQRTQHRSTRSSAERQKLKKKGQRRRFTLWLAFVLITSAILAGVGWLLANDMCSFNKAPVETTIEITRDDNLNTIATSHSANKLAIDIGERYRKSVVLHLTTHLEVLALKTTPNRIIPISHILLVVGIGKREHRILVGHLGEVLVQVAANTLGRRIGVCHLGMAGFQILKLVHQEVELLVGYSRLVKHIILIVVLMQLLTQIYNSFFFVHHFIRISFLNLFS